MSYIELHARSAFSFLRGASLPEHLAEQAAQLHIPAMALCDRDGVYGAPRFFAAAQEQGIRAIIGSELTMEDGTILPVLVETRAGYQNLCRLLTCAHLRAPKSKSAVRWDELAEFAQGLVALTGDEEGPLCVSAVNRQLSVVSRPTTLHAGCRDELPTTDQGQPPSEVLEKLVRIFGPHNVFVEIQRHHLRGEDRLSAELVA